MRGRLLASAAAGLLLIAGLAGCAATTPAAHVKDASVTFRCPTATELAALTATPLTASRAAGAACSYTSSQLGHRATVTVTHAASASTLAADRALQLARDASGVRDTRSVSFDAFEVGSPNGCTAWQYAVDGGVLAADVQGADLTTAAACDIARSFGVLAGTPAASAVRAPVVSVIAPTAVDGPAGESQHWASATGLALGARVDVVPSCGTGFVAAGAGGADYAACARDVAPTSAAIVVVASTADAARSAVAVRSAVRATIAAAKAAAPHARIVVVGPGAEDADDATIALNGTVAPSASAAGATVLDPIAGEWDALGSASPSGGIAATTAALTEHVTDSLQELADEVP